MSKKEFYDHSWNLNDKGLVRQGPNNQSVLYELNDKLDHPTKMYFYPSFHNDRVYRMRIKFKYRNWAPWNRDLYSDSLQVEVVDLFREWYGDGFTLRKTKKQYSSKNFYVKKDNNRRILVTTKGNKEVIAYITDIVAGKRVKEAKNQSSSSQ